MTKVTGPDRCQYCYEELVIVSTGNAESHVSVLLRRYRWMTRAYLLYLIRLGPSSFALDVFPRMGFWRRILGARARLLIRRSDSSSGSAAATLKPGDLVRVKPLSEVLETLDGRGRLRGLLFTPEMVKFTGKQFRVYKVLRKIILETTGELRTIRTPTVLLEGAVCDGSAHGSCDRSCFCFWREAWLSKVVSSA